MADLSHVENRMVDLIAGFLGLGDGYLAGSAVVSQPAMTPCKVYRGWPLTQALDEDIKGGITNVSVFPNAGATRRLPGYLPTWKPVARVEPTLTVSVDGTKVTFGGTGGAGQVAGIRFGPVNGGPSFPYRVLDGDTPVSVATAFAILIPGASAEGPTVTLPTNIAVQARVVADQESWQETRRQQQHVCVTAWCPNPVARDNVMSIIDAGFANLTDRVGRLTWEFALPDGSNARIRYFSNSTDDKVQQAGLWRRDVRYIVEYATTRLEAQPEVLFIGEQITDVGGAIIASFGDFAQGVVVKQPPPPIQQVLDFSDPANAARAAALFFPSLPPVIDFGDPMSSAFATLFFPEIPALDLGDPDTSTFAALI